MSLATHAVKPLQPPVSAASVESAPWDDAPPAATPEPVPTDLNAEFQEFLRFKAAQAAGTAVATVAPAPSTAVAVAPAAGVPSVDPVNLSAMGYQGLKIDFTSFPSIYLDQKKQAFLDRDGNNYGKDFRCRVMSTREQYIFRALAPGQSNPAKGDVKYSYDKVNCTDGIPVSQWETKWRQEGKVVQVKPALEVVVEMVAPGLEYDGDTRILTVPDKSVGRISGRIQAGAWYAQTRGLPTFNVVYEMFVGNEVTKVDNAFYPWDARVIKD